MYIYIYVCIYIYPSHFNCEGQGAVASLRFLWSRHVFVHVLRVRNAKKRSIQGKETLPQKRVRQRRESLTD